MIGVIFILTYAFFVFIYLLDALSKMPKLGLVQFDFGGEI